MNHGTTSTYKRHGCRCADCQHAYFLYNVRMGRVTPRFPVQPIVDVMTEGQRHIYKDWIWQRRKHGVRLYEADAMCIRLGLHPLTVYGDLWLSDTWGVEFGDAA